MKNLLSVRLSVLSLGVVLFLSGCANPFRSDVVTFHEGPLPQGETIRVVASDPAKVQSLEFRSYANLVSEELRKIGYTPVTGENADAQLLAEVDYSVESGEPVVQVNDPHRYVRYHFAAGRFYDPFYFGIYDTWGPWGPQVYTTPTYMRNLRLNIVSNDESRNHVFEGRVQSMGYDNQLPEIMPYLVTAMFSNFPGENGVTKVVTIERDK